MSFLEAVEIKKDIYWIGGLDPTLEIFDIVMETEFGTTYNSYLVKGEQLAIIETVKEKFFEEYLQNIKKVADPSKIDYIILNHTEPDHAGGLRLLLEHAPNATIVCSQAASLYLKEMLNNAFPKDRLRVVKDGDSLDLGAGKVINFISAPMLHWPDSIYSYLESEQVLFTCDSFGCHYCEEDHIFDDQIQNREGLLRAQKYYFDVIMGPFSNYVVSAYNKIKDLAIQTICPGHGPILRSDPWKVVHFFKEWAEKNLDIAPQGKIFIGYVSAYGYTERMAQAIKQELESAEYTVTMLNLGESDPDTIYHSIVNSEALLFGSPTINQDTVPPIWNTLSMISPLTQRGKLAGAFGSYGWSGEAVGMITDRLRGLKLKVLDPIRVKFIPSAEQLEECREFARKVIETLK